MQRYDSFEVSDSDELEEHKLGRHLLKAAGEGNLEAVDQLLRLGADVNYTDEIDYCALTRAAEGGHADVVRRLLQEEDLDTSLEVKESQDAIGGNALHIAAFNGSDEIVEMLCKDSPDLINSFEYCGFTPLHESILNRQFSTFKLLIQLGANIESSTFDSDATTTPEGLNSLGLIMYQLIDSTHDKMPLINMLFWLLDNHHPHPPLYSPFKVSEQGARLYSIVKNYKNNAEKSRCDLLNLLKVKKYLINTVAMKGTYGDLTEMSDSDSEDDADYQYVDRIETSRAVVEEKINKNFSGATSKTLVAHFRGVHRYPEHLKMKSESLAVAKAQEKGSLPLLPIYSSASHELAGVPYELPIHQSIETREGVNQYNSMIADRTQKLKNQDPKIFSAINFMRSQKDVKPCLQTSSTSRDRYESRYHEFIQRYVNSYAALLEDMGKNAKIDASRLKSEASKQKHLLFNQLGFTKLPLVSTTEDVHWAFEYAASLVSYDRKSTFRPNPNSGAQPLRPCYLPNGRPRFPYLGIVHATLHTHEELLDEGKSERVLDLFAENLIDTRCAAPGGHVTGGYIRAKERVFVSSIDAPRLFVAMMVRVPNLSYPYRQSMLEKYGLSEKQYNKFKTDLEKYGPNEEEESLRNENQYFRTQLKIIEFVIEYQQQKLLRFIDSCVKNKGFSLKALGNSSDELIDPIIRDSSEEKEFISGFIKNRERSKMQRTTTTPAITPSPLANQSIFDDSDSKKRQRDKDRRKDELLNKKPRKE